MGHWNRRKTVEFSLYVLATLVLIAVVELLALWSGEEVGWPMLFVLAAGICVLLFLSTYVDSGPGGPTDGD